MSAERVIALLASGLCLGSAALAEEQVPAADADFLEYLGMWEETDEDWLLFEETQAAETEKRSEPVTEGEATPEKTDES